MILAILIPGMSAIDAMLDRDLRGGRSRTEQLCQYAAIHRGRRLDTVQETNCGGKIHVAARDVTDHA